MPAAGIYYLTDSASPFADKRHDADIGGRQDKDQLEKILSGMEIQADGNIQEKRLVLFAMIPMRWRRSNFGLPI